MVRARRDGLDRTVFVFRRDRSTACSQALDPAYTWGHSRRAFAPDTYLSVRLRPSSQSTMLGVLGPGGTDTMIDRGGAALMINRDQSLEQLTQDW